jgi:hypothetical protein
LQTFGYQEGDGIADQFASDGHTKFGFKKSQKQLIDDLLLRGVRL